MSVTPQTNTTLKDIAEAMRGAQSFCICGHVSPDGDCIGSQLALRLALLKLGKKVQVLLAKPEPVDKSLEFLPGADRLIPARNFKGKADVFVCVDVPNEARLGDAAHVKARCASSITIDHHAVPERMSDLSYTDPDAAATCMLIWELVKHLGVAPDAEIATCALCGTMTDTGRFQHQNTDAAAFCAAFQMVEAGASPSRISAQLFQRRSVASLRLEAAAINNMQIACGGRVALSWVTFEDMQRAGATKADCETLVNVLRAIDGVCVAAMLRDEGGQIRGSFRAKDDTDVAVLAERFGGGGHKAAAGFTLYCGLDEARREVLGALEGVLGGDGARESGASESGAAQ